MRIVDKINNYIKENSYSPDQMRHIMAKFQEKYPHHEPGQHGLNVRDMDRILSGFKEYPGKTKAKSISTLKAERKALEDAELKKWIDKAASFSGDIAYEYTGGDQHKLENLSKRDIDMIHNDALDQVGCPDRLRDKALKLWKKMGYL